jgi:hypothetical protein
MTSKQRAATLAAEAEIFFVRVASRAVSEAQETPEAATSWRVRQALEWAALADRLRASAALPEAEG